MSKAQQLLQNLADDDDEDEEDEDFKPEGKFHFLIK